MKTDYEVVTSQNSTKSGSLLFCFLPLPIKTAFPVHINGYFAVHSSRTQIYSKTPFEKSDERAVWNESLLEDAATRAYCILLKDLTKLCPQSDSYSVWPTHREIEDIGFLQCLTRSLYSRICDTKRFGYHKIR